MLRDLAKSKGKRGDFELKIRAGNRVEKGGENLQENRNLKSVLKLDASLNSYLQEQ